MSQLLKNAAATIACSLVAMFLFDMYKRNQAKKQVTA